VLVVVVGVPVGGAVGEAGADLLAVAVAVGDAPTVGALDVAGEVGVVVVPPHASPLIVQFVGSPVPLAVKPNVVLAPAARVPFQLEFVTVYAWPLAVSVPFHSEVIVVPDGRLNRWCW
jgi:hypothetical protein